VVEKTPQNGAQQQSDPVAGIDQGRRAGEGALGIGERHRGGGEMEENHIMKGMSTPGCHAYAHNRSMREGAG